MIAINSVMTASFNRERCRIHVPEVGKKEELDCEEEAVKEPLPQHWEEQDSVEEVVQTEWWSVEENACNSSSAAKELEEGEVSAILGSSCETSVEPVWRRQRWLGEEGSDEDDKEESERPEQRLLLNVPILARHSSTDIMTNGNDNNEPQV